MVLHCLLNQPEFPHTSTHRMPPHLLLYPNFLQLPHPYGLYPLANRITIPQKYQAPSLSPCLCVAPVVRNMVSLLSIPLTCHFSLVLLLHETFLALSLPNSVFLFRIFTVLWKCRTVINTLSFVSSLFILYLSPYT